MLDTQGNVYGTTLYGDGVCTYCSIVFKVTPSGQETVLYTFVGGATGTGPNGALAMDSQGNLYGTTIYGGADPTCVLNGLWGCGIVFEVNPSGQETVLYNFTGSSYVEANGGLVFDAQGNLYGSTTQNGAYGRGTVFELKPAPSTTTKLTSSATSLTYAQWVTLTAKVTFSSGLPPDGETVSVVTSESVLGTGTLSAGTATFTTSQLPVGATAIMAFYPGDQSFAGSTSNTVTIVVGQATTTTALTSSVNPSYQNGAVTFTATVTPEYGGTPSGNMTFYDGTTMLTQVCFSGMAQFSTSTLGIGTHNITAVYSGDSDFSGSTSNVVSQVVNPPTTATTTALTASPNPALQGQSVTLTATVTNPSGGTPTGNVVFEDGSTALATITLSNGVASYNTSALPLGYNNLTALYQGDSKYSGSTSAPVNEDVQLGTTTVLASAPNPSTYNQPITFTATVSSNSGTPPDGETVTFKTPTSVLGTGVLNKGVCNLTTGALPAGNNSVTAIYPGDEYLAQSQSKAVKQKVSKASTTTTLVSSENPSTSGEAVTFTATVTAQLGGTIVGPVSFYDGATKLKTVAVSGGGAAFTTSKLAVGNHSITAKYKGNRDFSGSTSDALTQVVN